MNSRGLIWFGRTALASVCLSGSLSGESRLLTFTRFEEFQRTPGPRNDETILTSSELEPGFAWDEVVASWNGTTNLSLQVEVRPLPPVDSHFYSFGHWSAHPSTDTPRASLNGQKDSVATMQTDTLVLKQPAEQVQVRITLFGPVQSLKRLSLALTGPTTNSPSTNTFHEAWGHELGVPIRSQAEYPEGIDKWCSPTSTAMLLSYWGGQLQREELVVSVPETAAQVFDPGWGGTGNWSFNMAYAGSHSGLHSAVSRFSGLAELERWIASGAPAAASVSYAMLKGKSEPSPGDGHLVVVRGFTATGDVIVNDPGVRLDRVRRIFPRSDFERAWSHSKRTVYLVWPDGHRLPVGRTFPQY